MMSLVYPKTPYIISRSLICSKNKVAKRADPLGALAVLPLRDDNSTDLPVPHEIAYLEANINSVSWKLV